MTVKPFSVKEKYFLTMPAAGFLVKIGCQTFAFLIMETFGKLVAKNGNLFINASAKVGKR